MSTNQTELAPPTGAPEVGPALSLPQSDRAFLPPPLPRIDQPLAPPFPLHDALQPSLSVPATPAPVFDAPMPAPVLGAAPVVASSVASTVASSVASAPTFDGPQSSGAPTLPTLPAAPSSPLAPSAPSLPASSAQSAAPVAAAPAPETLSASSTPKATRQSAKRGGLFLGMLLIAVAAVVGFFGVRSLTGGQNETPAPPSQAPVDEGSPLVEPIEDARDVVDDINANSQEAELLDELGLDPSGRPQVPGYLYTTVDAAGISRSIQVDAATTNYSVEASDGTGLRSIGGTVFIREPASEEWTEADPASVAEFAPLGLDGLRLESDVISPELAPFVTLVSTERFEGTTTSVHHLDAGTLRSQDPLLLASWANQRGLNADGLARLGSEPIVITMTIDANQIVQSFELEHPGSEQSASYSLDAVYDASPLITR